MITPEEQKTNRSKWVSALRSGEYKQGKGSLKDSKGNYCCLGVACDISNIGYWEGADPWYIISGCKQPLTAFITPSEELMELYGIEFDQHDALVNLNDSGKTFEEIATVIESYG